MVEELSWGSNPNSWDPVFLRASQSLSFLPPHVLHMETLHLDDPLLAYSLPDSTLGFYITLIPCTLFCHEFGYIPSVFFFF